MLAQSLKDALKTDGADFDAAKTAKSTAAEARAAAEGDLAMTKKARRAARGSLLARSGITVFDESLKIRCREARGSLLLDVRMLPVTGVGLTPKNALDTRSLRT